MLAIIHSKLAKIVKIEKIINPNFETFNSNNKFIRISNN